MSHASIVVPLSGGPAQALRCLEGIAAQPAAPSHDVVVVDNASIGLEPLLAMLDGDVRVVRSERRLSFAAAAQLGAAHAQAEIAVLIRGMATPAAGWLPPLVSAMADPAVGLAASRDPVRPDRPLLAAWSAAIPVHDLRALDAPGLSDDLTIATLALSAAQSGRQVIDVRHSLIAGPSARGTAGRRAPGEEPELTIVVPTLDATSERVAGCLRAIAATTQVAHEIVIVDNGAPPQGFTAPVNAGLRAASTPYLVVMNDDVEVQPGWWEPLRARLDAGAAVAFPLTIDGAMRTDFAAWCFAMTRDTVTEFGHSPEAFFDPSLVVWYQDTDLLLALRRAGRPPVLVRDATIRHGLSETVASDDPQLREWVRARIAADEQRFVTKWAAREPRTLSAVR